MRARRPAETKLYQDLSCPRCGHGLSPTWARDTFRFDCAGGHEHRVRDLLGKPDPDLRRGVERLLGEWEDRLRSLWTSAQDAGRSGCLEIAYILARRSRHVAQRIEALRSRLPAAGGALRTPGEPPSPR